jgi:hypothetical protein
MNDIGMVSFLLGLALMFCGFTVLCAVVKVVEWWGARRGR